MFPACVFVSIVQTFHSAYLRPNFHPFTSSFILFCVLIFLYASVLSYFYFDIRLCFLPSTIADLSLLTFLTLSKHHRLRTVCKTIMRFDMFRRRGAPPPSPLPPSAYRSSSPSSYTPSSPSRWLSSDRPRTSAGSEHNASRSSSPSTSASSRAEFIAVLQARMELMEKVPTGSFSQSYAGEFDVSYSFIHPRNGYYVLQS